MTEAGYISTMMERIALSHPEVAIKLIHQNKAVISTSGSGRLKDVIYQIYGKDIAANLIPVEVKTATFTIDGFVGKPVISRGNRALENYFVNGRYIKNNIITKAIEDSYKTWQMVHKYPFTALNLNIEPDLLDVNLHPTKMEVRIADSPAFYEAVKEAIHEALHAREMIPDVVLKEKPVTKTKIEQSVPEPFEQHRRLEQTGMPARSSVIQQIYEKSRPNLLHETATYGADNATTHEADKPEAKPQQPIEPEHPIINRAEQMELFDDKLLSSKAKEQYEILGQIFDTFWLIAYQDKLLIVDQHAAHEKVKFERLMKHFREHDIVSQAINPPIIITLNGREKECYLNHAHDFKALGFIIEEFGGNEYAIRGVPMDLYGYEENEFFYEILDELADESVAGTPESIRTRIATMACKAAVKGNTRISRTEMKELIDELLTLDNPYNCPHGRPTIISMSKYELEKKFKRIVT